jgi:RimJ/RimL family protein N-acetyltransferase
VSVIFERVSWPRQTLRLAVRPATVDDLPSVFAYRTLDVVGRWMPSRPTSYDEWLLRMDGTALLERTLVVERETELVGDLYLRVNDAWAQAEASESEAQGSQAEIGWCFSPTHQGLGYATEAVAELVRLCFEDLGLRRLTAEAFADNVPSVRIMEKLGMRREAEHRQESLHRDLGWVDSVTYALLRDEWSSNG